MASPLLSASTYLLGGEWALANPSNQIYCQPRPEVEGGRRKGWGRVVLRPFQTEACLRQARVEKMSFKYPVLSVSGPQFQPLYILSFGCLRPFRLEALD